MEEWKDIEGYEGLYQVSNLGRVRSLDRKGFKGKILKLRTDSRKLYILVTICKNGIQKTYNVHRLVANAFIPNPDNLPQVNHKDENKQNNCVDNLEWCTISYNVNYGTRNSISGLKISKANTNNPLKCKQVIQIDLEGNVIAVYSSITEASLKGFNKGVISQCCRGTHNTHKGYKWQYLN